MSRKDLKDFLRQVLIELEMGFWIVVFVLLGILAGICIGGLFILIYDAVTGRY